MHAPFIAVRNLSKSFGAKPVLGDLSLDIATGRTTVILGGSGSGKSVLLKHMNGLLRPDAGSVRVDGEEITALGESALARVRKKVSMLFQMGALFDSLTVAENVAYPLREHTNLAEGAVAARVAEALALVDLPHVEGLYPSELSGGMKKRAALARALALEPQAVLYDEPTTGLDPVVAERINLLIRDLQRRLGITSVVVTHDLHSAFMVADRIAFLSEGRIRAEGTTAEIARSTDPVLREFLAPGASAPIEAAPA